MFFCPAVVALERGSSGGSWSSRGSWVNEIRARSTQHEHGHQSARRTRNCLPREWATSRFVGRGRGPKHLFAPNGQLITLNANTLDLRVACSHRLATVNVCMPVLLCLLSRRLPHKLAELNVSQALPPGHGLAHAPGFALDLASVRSYRATPIG